MDPRSEVLLRQAQLFEGELLLAGLPADDLLGTLPQACGWNWHAGDQALLAARFAGRSQDVYKRQPRKCDLQLPPLWLAGFRPCV